MEENEQTIDLGVLLKVLKSHLLPIAIVALACALVGMVLAAMVIPKKYTSESMMYVENSANKSTDAALNINDINAAQKIVNTCQVLFTSNHVLGQISESFDGYTIAELKGMISIEAVNNTEILKITVTSLSAQDASDIAAKLVEVSQEEFLRVIKNGSIEVVSSPTYPKSHTYPSTPKFTIIGFLIGLVVTYGVFLVIEMLDVKVKPGDDLMQMYGIPVFAEIMDFETTDKSNYKYQYYSTRTPAKSEKAKGAIAHQQKAAPVTEPSAGEKSAETRKERV